MNRAEIQKRISRLSFEQQQLLKAQLQQLGHPQQQDASEGGRAQLVAYVKSSPDVSPTDLKAFVEKRLPGYMVPSAFVPVNEFPRLPNGKIDTSALSVLYAENNTDYEGFVAPSTPLEKKLAAIWEQILGFEPIGLHDNFFEIGGDSILSIQIIAKARQQGVVLAANQLFEHQTIGELALFVSTDAPENTPTEKVEERGLTPLTPIQHWFFETHQAAPHFWNQAVLFTPNSPVNTPKAEQAVQYLLERHPALCLRFYRENDKWEASVGPANSIRSFETIIPPKTEDWLEVVLAAAQTDFDLSKPVLFKCLYLDWQGRRPNAVLFLAHHLLVDNISWNILLKDFSDACLQLAQQKPLPSGSRLDSIKTWAETLAVFSQKDQFKQEYGFWKKQVANSHSFPSDFDVALPFQEATIKSISISLDEATTSLLLEKALDAYKNKVEDLLITALLQTFHAWNNEESFCLGMEKHGRESLDTTINESNVVGWLTAYFPVNLTIESGKEQGTMIKSIKEQLRQIPNGGVGYGMLRYLEKEAALVSHPPVVFNFLGNMDKMSAGIEGRVEAIFSPTLRHPKSERYYWLEVNSFVANQRLTFTWSYSTDTYKKETIELRMKDFEIHLKAIIDHCASAGNTEYTPSDFPEAGLNQADLDNLFDALSL